LNLLYYISVNTAIPIKLWVEKHVISEDILDLLLSVSLEDMPDIK